MVPLQRFEKQYASLFSPDRGSPAKPFRMAFGALILKERLNCSDEELVEQIRENPYLQYFLGLEEFRNEAPFKASMLVHFRKRISLEMIGEVNEALVTGLRGPGHHLLVMNRLLQRFHLPPQDLQQKNLLLQKILTTKFS